MLEEAFQPIAGELKQAEEIFRAALPNALDKKRRSLVPAASAADRSFTAQEIAP